MFMLCTFNMFYMFLLCVMLSNNLNLTFTSYLFYCQKGGTPIKYLYLVWFWKLNVCLFSFFQFQFYLFISLVVTVYNQSELIKNPYCCLYCFIYTTTTYTYLYSIVSLLTGVFAPTLFSQIFGDLQCEKCEMTSNTTDTNKTGGLHCTGCKSSIVSSYFKFLNLRQSFEQTLWPSVGCYFSPLTRTGWLWRVIAIGLSVYLSVCLLVSKLEYCL